MWTRVRLRRTTCVHAALAACLFVELGGACAAAQDFDIEAVRASKRLEAVRVAEGSEFLKTVLGAEVHKKLMETKLVEADKFRLHVSEMDLKEHLKL